MYFIYLDESGISNLNAKNPREDSDFFVLGGIIIKEKDLAECNEKFKQFKKDNSPEELWDYPVHAVELNHISRHKKTKYKDILTDEEGREFLDKLFKFINELPIEAICILIDNHELKKKYPVPINPYYLSYEFLVEKCQKIIEGRDEPENKIGMVNLAQCSATLTTELKRIHGNFMTNGTRYKKLTNIFHHLNIEDNKKSCCYEIADLVCYAFRRSYYSWLCKNMGKMEIKDNYLSSIKKICTLKIGHILFDGDVRLKVFPDPRYLEKKGK